MRCRTTEVVPSYSLCHCWFALLLNGGLGAAASGNGMVEVDISRGGTGNEPRSAAEGHVLDCPLHENYEPALELDDVHKVDEGPHDPRRQAPEVHAENVGHCGGASDNCEVSFIEVAERCWLWFTFHFPRDGFRGVSSALHRHLRNPLQRLAVRVDGESHVSDYKDVREIGDGEVRADFDPSATIRFSPGALRQRFGEWRYCDASSPDHRFCG